MCRFASLCKHFFPVQIDNFSVFFRGELRKQPKFHILLILTGKMHQNGLSAAYLGFKACQIQCRRFQVLAISSSWKITIWGKNFTFCWFGLGKMHQICLSGAYLGFKACWIQWYLLGVSDKWFIKNHNFRRHIAEHGAQNHENGMGHMQQSSLGPILPLHHVSEPYILTFPQKCRKTIITQKLLVTQSSNIVHCNRHTQKPICADLQAFANTFSLW